MDSSAGIVDDKVEIYSYDRNSERLDKFGKVREQVATISASISLPGREARFP